MTIEQIENRIRELDAWLYNNPGSSRWRVLEELQSLEERLTEACDYEDQQQSQST